MATRCEAWAPAQQRITPPMRRAALRPGNEHPEFTRSASVARMSEATSGGFFRSPHIAVLMRATRSAQRRKSTKLRRDPHHLSIEAIESVIRARLASVAFIDAPTHPDRSRPAGRPFYERLDAGRQGHPAAIL